jgi:hypothetical protein
MAPERRRRRAALTAAAVALTATAVLAIGILLFGSFGETEGKILSTTVQLALFSLVALPGAILLDQGRLRALAGTLVALAAVAFCLGAAVAWSGDPPAPLGRAFATAIVFAVAASQTAGLAARRRDGDPPAVGRLFAVSTVLAAVLASAATAAIWTAVEAPLLFRVLGAALVLDVLLVALQPLLGARGRYDRVWPLRVRVEPGDELVLAIRAPRLAVAVGRAVDEAEHSGRRVVAVEVAERSLVEAPAPPTRAVALAPPR